MISTMIEPTQPEVQALTELVYERFHYDFRHYARASLLRRLQQALQRLGFSSLGELAQQLDRDPALFPRLLPFLTVQVSDLFRDPDHFLALRRHLIPELRTYPSLRVWVAGCSTGEEAYALAILLREEGLLDRSILYATDIHPDSLRKAETGVYSIDRLPVFTEAHRRSGAPCSLSEHYTAAYGGAVFDRSLRERIVFSDHSLATDSVFAEVQLISCRNVLIYFDPVLQDRALGLFHESLCRRGVLGLGARETLRFSALSDAFSTLDIGGRWFQKR